MTADNPSDPQMGMGFDGPAVHHVAALSECDDLVQAMHLMVDHDIPTQTVVTERHNGGTLVMLHMSLHGHVIEVRDDEEGTDGD